MKLEEPSGSASAKLLKAVKMKQECKSLNGSSSTSPYSKPPALSPKPASLSSSTPPSHSSLIFGSAGDEAGTKPPSESACPASLSPALPAMPMLTGQATQKHSLDPLDMRVPGYKSIAPAPPKLTNMSPKLHSPQPAAAASTVKSEPSLSADVKVVVDDTPKEVTSRSNDDEDDDDEGALVISEQAESEADNSNGEITPEVIVNHPIVTVIHRHRHRELLTY